MIQPAAVLRTPTPSTRIAAPQIAATGLFSLDAVTGVSTDGATDGAAGAVDLPAIDTTASQRQPLAATGSVLPVTDAPVFAWTPIAAPAPLPSAQPPAIAAERTTPAPPTAMADDAKAIPGASAGVATVALNTSALTPLPAPATRPASTPITPASKRASQPRDAVAPQAASSDESPAIDERAADATKRDSDRQEPTTVVAMPIAAMPVTLPIMVIPAPPTVPAAISRETPAPSVDTVLPLSAPTAPIVAAPRISEPDLSPARTPTPIPAPPSALAATPPVAASAPPPAAPPVAAVAAGAAGLQVAAEVMGAMPAMTRRDTDSAAPIQPLAMTPEPTVAAAAGPVAPTAGPAPVDTPSRWTPLTGAVPLAIIPSQPQPAPQPGIVAPAAQIFGAAIAAARRQDDPARRTDAPIDAAVVAGAAPAPSVTPATAAQQAPLDMRQERWPHAMIDRIASLRDAANQTDTRIRLIPDALGTIDISVKTDGDAVHVRFAAEQAATRTMLQDAQPRLADLAESRGLKLTQSSVDARTDAGTGPSTGQQHRGAAPHQAQTPKAPPRGPRAADTDSTDTRLA